MDPFAYAMALIATQDMQLQFEEPKRRRSSAAHAPRERSKFRRLAGRFVGRRARVPATECA
jgi:hypothetical protein